MSDDNQAKFPVAVIGAGPAGLYAARYLAEQGVHVALINRDIRPGGLAEYGIYPDKTKMKEGLRRQFRQILDNPLISYFGNVVVGRQTGLPLEDLHRAGFQAILVAVGAQGTKWLGLPGEDLEGVYHAKELVYHYNRLPPFSQQDYPIGRRAALIGAGNVMLDIARWLIRDLKVEEVVAVARRGPAEVKFARKEMEAVGRNLDLDAFEREIERVAPVMLAAGQDIDAAKEYILAALPKAMEPVSDTRFRFSFLASPSRILGNAEGKVCGLEVEDTTLVPVNGDTKARRLGTRWVIGTDTVIFCIGDRVDETFGLPVQWNEFVKAPNPHFPVDGLSYEVYDPEAEAPFEGIFVAGWAREASSGLVGVARKDGENGAKALLQYLRTLPAGADKSGALEKLYELLQLTGRPVITKEDIQRLEEIEQMEAERLGVEVFRLKSNEEMLAAIERKKEF